MDTAPDVEMEDPVSLGHDTSEVDAIIAQLLAAEAQKPGMCVDLPEHQIRMLCTKVTRLVSIDIIIDVILSNGICFMRRHGL